MFGEKIKLKIIPSLPSHSESSPPSPPPIPPPPCPHPPGPPSVWVPSYETQDSTLIHEYYKILILEQRGTAL
jgi:hypothetical protein